MRKLVYITVFLIIFIFVIRYVSKHNILAEIRYELFTKTMSDINSKQLLDIEVNSKDENYIIYVGRKSCPDCIEIIKKINSLKDLFEEDNYEFYYFDTDKYKNEVDFQEALDLYDIDFIPTVVISLDFKKYILNHSDLIHIEGDVFLE